MGLFDRFKKKPPEPATSEWPKAPEPDTSCLMLMDRVLNNIEPVAEHLRASFGPQAVSGIDTSHPRVPAFIVTIDGLEFWCSHLPMPVPKNEMDIPYASRCNLFLSPEEQEAFSNHRSFWLIAQKGGGTSLEQKRQVCWAFSLLCAALLEQEGAVGVCRNTTGQLIGKENYLSQRARMEGKAWDDPEYFPVPLWIWLFKGASEEKPTIETWGLKEFGLPELGFFSPKLPVQDILNYLYTMSCFQITGQQLYRNMALIPLTPEIEVICKRSGEKLYFIGG